MKISIVILWLAFAGNNALVADTTKNTDFTTDPITTIDSIDEEPLTIPGSIISYRYSEENFDERLFRRINSSRNSFFDNVVIPITEKSIFPMGFIPQFTLVATSIGTNNYYDQNSAALLLTSNAVSLTLTIGVKNIFQKERPLACMGNVYCDRNFSDDKYSFPSGHTSNTFSTATSLALRYPDNPALITGLYLHALAVSYGRIYIGAHYPSDVLAGVLIGTGSAILVHSLRKEIIDVKANILGQQERVEEGSDKVNQYAVLASVILSDLVSYIMGIRSDIGINLGSTGSSHSLNFSYQF
jgi:hypothetical protein